MGLKIKQLILSGLLLVGSANFALAEETAPAAAPAAAPVFSETVSVSGFADAYFTYNNNGWNGLGDNKYQNFNFDSGEADISLVELNLSRNPAADKPVGFYIGLAFGPTANAIACNGSTTCAAGSTVTPEAALANVRQAYASILAAPNLQLDFGKFVTQHGSEVIESRNNWNYTHSILFAFAIPYYHSGARLMYTINDSVNVMVDVTNGWNAVTPKNGGKTLGLQVNYTPVKSLPIILNYMTGPESFVPGAPGTSPAPGIANSTAGAVTGTRSLFDIVATYNATDALSFMVNYDNGSQANADTAGGNAAWNGWAGYVRYAFAPTYAVAIRAESLSDTNGFTTGTKQTLSEQTLTLEKAIDGALLRLDIRQDSSDQKSFTKADNTATNSQLTITFGAVVSF